MSKTSKPRQPPAARRAGYVASIVVFIVGYWAVGRLIDWSWVPFITSEFPDVVPTIRVGIIASIAVNVVYLVWDPRSLRALGEAVTSAFSTVIGIIVVREFPFDFSTSGWETLARIVMIVGIVCSAVAVVVNLVTFVIALFTEEPSPA